MKFTHTLTIDVGRNAQITVEVEFTCSPYIPEQGPSYSSGGQPAEGGEVEITSGVILIEKGQKPGAITERVDAPEWLLDIINGDDDLLDDLRVAAAEDEGPDPDAAYEARRDERDAA